MGAELPPPPRTLLADHARVSRPSKGFLINAFAVVFFSAMAAFASWLVVALAHQWRWFYWPAMALLAGCGLGGLYVIVVTLRDAARRQDTPTSTIRGAAQGAVELRGRIHAIPGRELHSHLLGIACVSHNSKLEGVKTGEMDDTLVDVSATRSFILRDGTGEVFVPAGFCQTGLAAKVEESRSQPPAHVRAGDCRRYDWLRLTEWVVPIDIDAQANGTFRTLGADEDLVAILGRKRDSEAMLSAAEDWRIYAAAAMAAQPANMPPPRLNVMLPVDGQSVSLSDPAEDQSTGWDAITLLALVSASPLLALLDEFGVIRIGPALRRLIALATSLAG